VLGRLVARRRRRLRRMFGVCTYVHRAGLDRDQVGPAADTRRRPQAAEGEDAWKRARLGLALDRVSSWNRSVMGNARCVRGGALGDAVLAVMLGAPGSTHSSRTTGDRTTLLESSSSSSSAYLRRREKRSEDAVGVTARSSDSVIGPQERFTGGYEIPRSKRCEPAVSLGASPWALPVPRKRSNSRGVRGGACCGHHSHPRAATRRCRCRRRDTWPMGRAITRPWSSIHYEQRLIAAPNHRVGRVDARRLGDRRCAGRRPTHSRHQGRRPGAREPDGMVIRQAMALIVTGTEPHRRGLRERGPGSRRCRTSSMRRSGFGLFAASASRRLLRERSTNG
jgi:hypothetical protein